MRRADAEAAPPRTCGLTSSMPRERQCGQVTEAAEIDRRANVWRCTHSSPTKRQAIPGGQSGPLSDADERSLCSISQERASWSSAIAMPEQLNRCLSAAGIACAVVIALLLALLLVLAVHAGPGASSPSGWSWLVKRASAPSS